MSASMYLLTDEVTHAVEQKRPVVALESSVISQGLPWPENLETALAAEDAVRSTGAVPATIAVLDGKIRVGLNHIQLERLADPKNVFIKASRRDLSAVIAHQKSAATTVASTMWIAAQAGISVFATGGIGGVHPQEHSPFDISSDLSELARTPVLVVCAGAKSILDLRRTLELLETFGVPVIGFRTDEFPAFYSRSSGLPTSGRIETPEEAAHLFEVHRQLHGAGMLLCQPLSSDVALDPDSVQSMLDIAQRDAFTGSIRGPELTPYLLRRLSESSGGRTLIANRMLIVDNARLAGQIAVELAEDQ